NGKEIDVDNRWVVPHNPYLLKLMQCHINVEAINTIATVFYVFKYMFKGDDKAFVEMNEFMDSEMVNSLNYDEINSYEDFRYISACEAHWRLSDFWMYRLSHSVDRLPVHLENEQTVYMGENPDETEMDNAKNKDSKLMAFFKVNQEKEKEIEKVKAQIEQLKTEGKNVNHIKVPEKLLYIPGPTSFENIRTVEGKTYESNRDACVALGLVLNDKLYEDTLYEALNHTSPNQFRYLFARLLAHCDLGNPLELFDQFEDHLTSDLLKKWQKDDAKKVAWRKIVKSMINQEKQLSDYPQLEAYMNEIGYENEETVDLKALLDEGWADYGIMNEEQKAIVDPIIKKIQSPEQIVEKCCIFADGPGGCGKSYLFNTVRPL
uniref:DNA helicase n=1 Tax=Panagrolaimus sp. PS1159 TaxID=55785 RepID=A0AC35GRF3_9BILA